LTSNQWKRLRAYFLRPALTSWLLIPDPLHLVRAYCSETQWIRDQASNPIFNVVSPHMRAGFGLIPDPIPPFRLLHRRLLMRQRNWIRDQFWLITRRRTSVGVTCYNQKLSPDSYY